MIIVDGVARLITYKIPTSQIHKIGYSGSTLCLEAAAGYNGLSTYCWYDQPMLYYETYDNIDYVQGLIGLYHCKKLLMIIVYMIKNFSYG